MSKHDNKLREGIVGKPDVALGLDVA